MTSRADVDPLLGPQADGAGLVGMTPRLLNPHHSLREERVYI